MSNATNICVRTDTELKAEAEELFSELGMNLSTAITVFLRHPAKRPGPAADEGIGGLKDTKRGRPFWPTPLHENPINRIRPGPSPGNTRSSPR